LLCFPFLGAFICVIDGNDKERITEDKDKPYNVENFRLFFFFQGLIFVVDSNDRERIGEANDELQKMVSK